MNVWVIVAVICGMAAAALGLQGLMLWISQRQEDKENALRRRLGLPVEADLIAAAAAGEDDSVASIIRDKGVDAGSQFLGEYGERLQVLIRASGAEKQPVDVVREMGIYAFIVAAIMLYLVGVPGILFAPLGAYISYSKLRSAADKRAAALLSQLPDALEMMSRAMQTGTGLSEAFRLASEEMDEPVALEFGRIYEQVRLGKEWREALGELVERNPTLFDLRLFVSTLLLQKDTGGNMIETLSTIAKTIRNRYVFDAKVKAMTSEARASGFVLAAMPLGVIALIVVASPAYMKPLIYTPVGHVVLMLAACMYGFGLYMMKNVAQVEV